MFEIEDESLREMLQALLIDRFQLTFHQETKNDSVYLLKKKGKRLGLRPVATHAVDADLTEDRPFGSIGYAGGRWVISARASVLDRTDLSGQFDYKQLQPDSEPNYQDNSDSFFQLISEVGLKLVRTKGPVEIFVIDQAAKPAPN